MLLADVRAMALGVPGCCAGTDCVLLADMLGMFECCWSMSLSYLSVAGCYAWDAGVLLVDILGMLWGYWLLYLRWVPVTGRYP